ncbi:hypothetical protein CC2G_010871 [Coprinopsis cinerea AmutBmut pab1-1]|nr:hypothetical protein CC2G_010871 [Coprinopsis cinerea AmutBmut pab1-1]
MSAPQYNYLAPAMPVPPLNEEESLFMVTNAQYAVRLENRLLETPGAEPVARIVSIGHMIALIIAQLMGIVNTIGDHRRRRPHPTMEPTIRFRTEPNLGSRLYLPPSSNWNSDMQPLPKDGSPC